MSPRPQSVPDLNQSVLLPEHNHRWDSERPWCDRFVCPQTNPNHLLLATPLLLIYRASYIQEMRCL